MKKILSVLFGSLLSVIFLYLTFNDLEQLAIGKLESSKSIVIFTLFSFFFLLSDILLPVPSSIIMIMNGSVLGLSGGALVSLFAGLTSSCIGYALGRKSTPFINRFFGEKELKSGDGFFTKYGTLAIGLSKAIPVVSESVSFLSGTTAISFKRFFVFSFCGHFVVSFVYAYAGSLMREFNSVLISAVIISLTLVIAYFAQWVLKKAKNQPSLAGRTADSGSSET